MEEDYTRVALPWTDYLRLDEVIVDHSLDYTNDSSNREEELAEITRLLKPIASKAPKRVQLFSVRSIRLCEGYNLHLDRLVREVCGNCSPMLNIFIACALFKIGVEYLNISNIAAFHVTDFRLYKDTSMNYSIGVMKSTVSDKNRLKALSKWFIGVPSDKKIYEPFFIQARAHYFTHIQDIINDMQQRMIEY